VKGLALGPRPVSGSVSLSGISETQSSQTTSPNFDPFAVDEEDEIENNYNSTISMKSRAEINANVNNDVVNANGSESSFYSNYNLGRSTSNDKSRKGRHTTNGNVTPVTNRLISSQRSPLSIEAEPSESGLNANNTANFNANHPNRINYIPGSRKLFVNVALNEDLSCTYRNSKLSAFSVDGNIQILLKADSTAFVPFTLKLSDVYDNIESILENTKFASVISKEEYIQEEDFSSKNKFIVTLPRYDHFFPVLKYRCRSSLIPVPLVSVLS
jgi:hypothetical protein